MIVAGLLSAGCAADTGGPLSERALPANRVAATAAEPTSSPEPADAATHVDASTPAAAADRTTSTAAATPDRATAQDQPRSASRPWSVGESQPAGASGPAGESGSADVSGSGGSVHTPIAARQGPEATEPGAVTTPAGAPSPGGPTMPGGYVGAGTASGPQGTGATGTPVPSPAVPSPSPAPANCGSTRVRTVEDALRLVTEPAGCPGGVNTFWQEQLGKAWTTPKIISYHNGQAPDDECGRQADPDQFADNALYCTLDGTVAYSIEFMNDLAAAGGPSYPLFVLMHELSHRGDRIGKNLGVVPRAEENQADCFAGRQTAAAREAGLLEMSDALSGAMLFFSLGDTRGGWFNQEPATAPDAHGSPTQRAQAFSSGYLRDNAACLRIGQSETGDV
ncbi:hypothetical protein [Candidatus Frankia nodulisporulans]|uniref:hypothetical protein n=1 Tax=Candidatus Frankia nodulisporulans TaxID=2060052 RepID=UPI001FD270DE|nr:hypothetical protein [Candidatus Frankia nodulisporulans]